MKFSSLLGMTSAAVLCVAAGVASAAPSFAIDPMTGFGSFTDSKPATGSFTDYFTFNMPSTATTGLSGIHVTGNSPLIDFTYLGLFQGTVGLGQYVTSASSIGAQTLDLTSFILPGANPYPNAYYVEVMGKASNGNPGYGGTISVSPVPEPKTYAMLLAGLGLLAFTARRRRTSFF
jgi:hypothetical protein